jgi:hypothetical protein
MLISYEFLGSTAVSASVFVSYDFLSMQLFQGFGLNKLSIGHAVARGMVLYPLGLHSRVICEIVEEDLIDDLIMLVNIVFAIPLVVHDLFLFLAVAEL